MRTVKYMDEEAVIKGVYTRYRQVGSTRPTKQTGSTKVTRIRPESIRRHPHWQRLVDKDRFFDEVSAQ